MTKSERLLFIVNLFRVRKRVTLEELARECEVSKRTIYRDLLSLSSLNIPIYYDDGYRLTREISLPALNFSDEEQEILGYCLSHNFLNRSSFLKSKLRNIEVKIISALPEKTRSKEKKGLGSSVLTSKRNSKRFTDREDALIGEFFRALFSRNEIELRLTNGDHIQAGLQPHSLEIEGRKWVFCFSDGNLAETIRVPLEEVANIKIIRARKV
ncbi:MAG: HTH domain-containing protein [Candidatus Zixiibacteriota bacterium]|jgi:predicted DNA-binding transcriptional regulator YafY